ncbi:PREDICTED: uncharacterized protein LOC107192625 [Dufourea novaeangliae]|uniref:Protein chiffon n=1 Tax=Dufourea novaeangliae TaxID=178035 RepID=A0A154PRA1_DUFNO|nr:PREDICTED: uncharacterized protein LOC107192625 [Dufourea novaeangliae]KZC14422.1 Protein chiffon [Dufourea novaeangliae]
MVSPSKIQHQEHKQPSRENKLTKHSHVRTEKDLKPLGGKSFYLDIKNHATTAKIEAKIKDLGGVIELFLVRSVNLVVSDRVNKSGYINLEKHKWGCASGGSGGPPSLRSLETPTPMPTPQTPYFSPDSTLSSSIALRGQTTQRSKSRVDAMLERALIQPQQCSVDPLYNAKSWGIPIWAVDKLQAWLDKIYSSVKDTNHLKQSKHSYQQSSTKDLKVRHLKGPYIKFEAFQRNTRPVFVELPVWPTLNFSGNPGSCPFNAKRRERPEKLRVEIKENREGIQPVKQGEDREMTRRPRTTATRARRTEQLSSGYCEICRISYRDLTKHVQSDQHLSFVRNNDNFLSLDTLINAGANVEAFLKLNRTKNIEKDCNLFSNGDRNLHDIVLPEGKVNRDSKSLGDFEVEDIKMVQCNGARRNLNLRLSSPHNLRTRAKHESGHLLRSKGSPWHEVEKPEKFYDKFEGYTIKKRAKGTIWIEEDEPEDVLIQVQELKEPKQDEYKIKAFSTELGEKCKNEKDCGDVCNKQNNSDNEDAQKSIVSYNEPNNIANTGKVRQNRDSVQYRNHEQHMNGSVKNNSNEVTLSTNENNCNDSCKISRNETVKGLNCKLQLENVTTCIKKSSEICVGVNTDVVCNGHVIKDEQGINKLLNDVDKNDVKADKPPRCFKSSRRGGRGFRGRHRLSVEERLIEDNRAYYKVEVLGSKLRSSVISNSNSQCAVQKDVDGEDRKEVPSSEKPVVVRFKRVRKSELSLLSDEAESFMFGEPRREDSSETSDDEQSSILPRETESECNDTVSSEFPGSSIDCASPVKSETIEDDSQDSLNLGRARKRRRTQAEALIKDNEDYYKFETPGSRLRYQAPLTGIKEPSPVEQTAKTQETIENVQVDEQERVYPSKPSPEVEKMQFSFEAIPASEPWYQTYQRQDEGAEFWHYFSQRDSQKPFLLPYEIENFHEILAKNQSRSESKRKGRGRSTGCMGRSPRKSPRCHASTLAIMSTIIRKREQQQQTSKLYTIDECQIIRSQADTPRPEQKVELKLDIDEELKDMVKTLDEMLNGTDNFDVNDSFEPDTTQIESNLYEPNIPKGPPSNLLELLENCHEIANCLENSSCASSECGEGNVESPSKRRKKRKNRTGWPGIKMKKKLQSKPSVDVDCGDRENVTGKDVEQVETSCDVQDTNTTDRLAEESNVRIPTSVPSISHDNEQSISVGHRKDDACLCEVYSSNITSNTCHDGTEKNDASAETLDDSVLHTNTETCTEPPHTPDICNETERNFILNKDYTFRNDLSEIEEISENDPGNDENHVFRKDVNSIAERRFIAKATIKKRQRDNTSAETCESRAELENHENLRRKETEAGIVPRKHHNANGLPRKRQQKLHSENPDSEVEHHNSVYKRSKVTSKKRMYSRKCARRDNIPSDAVFEDENCKEDSYLSITCKKQQNLRGVKRRADAVSSETQDSEVECALSGRVSPTIITTSELEQRRSSIEFQPVVRMMKIDDQVDMDHSILSVTIASNRRLRSSSSPRSNVQPPKKRLKTGRGQFGRWLKSS